MQNLKTKTREYNRKETDSQIQKINQRLIVGRDKIRVEDKEVQTIMYKIKKLQGCTVQHRGYNQYLILTINGI